MPCQAVEDLTVLVDLRTAIHHGPVKVPDEITGAGKCRIRNQMLQFL